MAKEATTAVHYPHSAPLGRKTAAKDPPPAPARAPARPIVGRSDPVLVYMHPDGKKQLKLFAVEQRMKVHDLMLQAVEEWAATRGLAGPFRVPPLPRV